MNDFYSSYEDLPGDLSAQRDWEMRNKSYDWVENTPDVDKITTQLYESYQDALHRGDAADAKFLLKQIKKRALTTRRNPANPHNWLTKLNAKHGIWFCNYCGLVGTYDELENAECDYVYPPCDYCGETPLCAPNCTGVISAMAGPDVEVISDMETPDEFSTNPSILDYEW